MTFFSAEIVGCAFQNVPTRRWRRSEVGDRVFGGLTRGNQDASCASAFVRDMHAPDGCFHLKYVGRHPFAYPASISWSKWPWYESGPPALTGSYLVHMLPQTAMVSSEERFVTDRRQLIPLAGVSDFEMSDLLGTTAAPLLQVPLSAVEHPGSCDPHVFVLNEQRETSGMPDTPSVESAPLEVPLLPSVIDRLSDDQRRSFTDMLNQLPSNLRETTFDPQGPG